MAEQADAPEEAVEGGQEAAPKKKGGKVLLIFGLVLGLGGGGAAGALYLAPLIGERLAAGAGTEAEQAGGGGGAEDDGHGNEDSHGDDAGEEAPPGSVHVVDNLVVNPAGSQGRRFLLADVAFETTDAGLEAEIAARDFELRDGLTRVLGMKTVDQLTDYTQREALVAELEEVIEAVLGPESVIRIFLPRYVIQ